MFSRSLSAFRFFRKPTPKFLKLVLAPSLAFSLLYSQQRRLYATESPATQNAQNDSPIQAKLVETTPGNPDMLEYGVPEIIHEGEMREVQLGSDPKDIVIISKIDGKYYCVQSKCPHVGAPLIKGLLFNDKLICPFHSAAFNITTGYPESGPVFNGLDKYDVAEKDGKVTIFINKSKKVNVSQTMSMSKYDPTKDKRKYAIVGAGPAALSCAETLRQSGFEGEIVLIGEEQALPYDRTNLSKMIFGASLSKFLLRKQEFYSEHGISVLTNSKVAHIDYEANTLYTRDFQRVSFDKLLIATGGSPRKPNVPGINLENVLVLRSIQDQTRLQSLLQSKEQPIKNIVVIGASFIGMETASAIKKELKENVNITVVDIFKAPFERVLGAEVGNALADMHKSNGIEFLLEKGLKSLNGLQKVQSATLSDGTDLPADLVILGTGISPNVALAKGKLQINEKNGGIETDVYLKTNRNNVFAAGDVASFPYWPTAERVRIEHYNEAIYQGSIAAFNMLGKQVPVSEIPFFWTRQWDKSLQYTGFATNYDEVHVEGDLKALKFAAYYIKGDQVLAVASMNQLNLVQLFNEAMKLNLMPKASEIKAGKFDANELKKRISAAQPASKCSKEHCCRKK